MALLLSQGTAAVSPKLERRKITPVARVTTTLRMCASQSTRTSFVHEGAQLDIDCKPHGSTLYHKGWVCVASILLSSVAVQGLAKLHTLCDAGAAVWALMGAFWLAGWS